jgi:ubiquinone/menaquinone biosynthesis C-methylase UbiE
MKLYLRFSDHMPWYLVRYYWWAYLWRRAVWFFDHQMIINAILFGQYRKLMRVTMSRLEQASQERILQLTCVYGELTPKLTKLLKPNILHITDVATVQLELARRKNEAGSLQVTRMNAESLGYKGDLFSTIILFFLLHEMPPEARINTLSECMRTIQPGGTLLLTEYGPLPTRHWLYRFPPFRWLLTTLEPFLGSFWELDLEKQLSELAAKHGKEVSLELNAPIFAGFYRVMEFKVSSIS